MVITYRVCSTQYYGHNTPGVIDIKLLEKSNIRKSFARVLHLMRQSNRALEDINTLKNENTPAEWFCSGLQSKENMVMGVILDVDETTS